ncbi:MAG: T9SS type A sorting domain-containing protein [Bacteroidia bacterium]
MDKKILFRTGLSLLLTILFVNVYATIHVVQVSNFQFSPNSLNVNVGDTIRWTWVNGTHTTTSGIVPSGAASWNSPISSSSTTFDYKVTVAGSYSYICVPHEGMNMIATFTASGTTGIAASGQLNATTLFPNPFVDELFIEQGNEQPEYTQISISDILGKQIKNVSIESLPVVSIGKRRIEVGELPKGIYFVTLKGNGAKVKTVRLVKEGA